jgi:hypothetical protein
MRIFLLIGLALLVGCSQTKTAMRLTSAIGLSGDGKTDSTAPLQEVVNALGHAGGGSVQLPRGNFLFTGHVNVPSNVIIEGTWPSVPSHVGLRDKGFPKPTDGGTTFLVTGDAGREDAQPFMTLNTNCTLRGVVIFYPDQTRTEIPTPYPYAIAMRGKNPAVVDCELLNPYNGIDASGSERHLIRNVQGQPLRRGIYIDTITDIGRIENVHFNPWFSMSPKLLQWQMDNGEGFVFGRADWEYVLNTFCFGYHVGYRFIKTSGGVCNGNFLGIGADDCQTSLQVDDSAIYGLLITNGEFVSFHGPDPTMVRVSASNTGVVRFVNCAYWGPCNEIAMIDGTGTVGFSDCTFVQWGGKKRDRAAIQAKGGTVMVQNCTFREDAPQVKLDAGLRRAIVTGNVLTGATRIENHASNAIVENNLGDSK